MLITFSYPRGMEEAGLLDGFNRGAVDAFSVDELLNFSNQEELWENEEDDEKEGTAPLLCREIRGNGTGASFFDPFPFNDLNVSADELANLEWLSDFVDDAKAEYPMPPPWGTKLECEDKKTAVEPGFVASGFVFNLPFPSKARSKRRRKGGRVWQSPESSVSSSSSVSSYSQTAGCSGKKRRGIHQHGGTAQVGGRRCTHCGVQKTPQWRAGPMGTKTLCNACGVRFKSGRLLPEYRPASSPTYSSQFHSNSHRKVLEMRKRKYSILGSEPGY